MFPLAASLVWLAAYQQAVTHATNMQKPSEVSEGPVVVAPSGQFRGAWLTSRRGRVFESYRGIRYAEPPVGGLRFQPPKPVESYKEVVDATKDGPYCPQPGPADRHPNEDCLAINVYTPDSNSSNPLPVVVFIHPGGFYSFSSLSDVFGPHYLLDRDLVLVTFNYRLGTLGFLSTGDELAPGNNGLKDQVAALQWVRRFIRSFGGDPDLVTLAGYSAGSTSVALHTMSPMSKGLFHRAMALSASPIDKAPLRQDLKHLAARAAELVNCPKGNSSEMISCLKTKTSKQLAGSLLGFFEFGFDPVSLWAPVVEKDFGQQRFLDAQPVDIIREGRLVTPVPMIVSQTTGEFFWKAFTVLKNETLLKEMNTNWDRIAPISFQLPRKNSSTPAQRLRQEYLGGKELVRDERSADGLGKLYSDSIVGVRVHRYANLLCRHSPHKVFYYQFSYTGNHSFYEDPETKKPTEAAHHDDLLYVFSMAFRFPMIPADDSKDSKMVDKMTAIWYNFARFGDPNPRDSDQPELATLNWPAMTAEDRSYLNVDEEFTVQRNMKEERLKIWDELYPIQY